VKNQGAIRIRISIAEELADPGENEYWVEGRVEESDLSLTLPEFKRRLIDPMMHGIWAHLIPEMPSDPAKVIEFVDKHYGSA
jgi:hypothetical protein